MKNQLLLCRIPLAIAAASLLCGLAARADQLLKVPFDLPVKVSALVDESGCDNSPGTAPTCPMLISCIPSG